MHDRILQLIEQFNEGASELQALDRRRANLRDSLLRISGAIEVLRELCTKPAAPLETPTADSAPQLSHAHAA